MGGREWRRDLLEKEGKGVREKREVRSESGERHDVEIERKKEINKIM